MPNSQTLKSITDLRDSLANSALETTISKILEQTEKSVISNVESALNESLKTLDDSVPKLEQEFDKIIADGKKEADKIEKQIMRVPILRLEINN